MHSAGMEFEITPSRSSVVTFDTGTVESEEFERFFHDVLCLKEDREFGVFIGNRVEVVGREVHVRRGGEDDR